MTAASFTYTLIDRASGSWECATRERAIAHSNLEFVDGAEKQIELFPRSTMMWQTEDYTLEIARKET